MGAGGEPGLSRLDSGVRDGEGGPEGAGEEQEESGQRSGARQKEEQ